MGQTSGGRGQGQSGAVHHAAQHKAAVDAGHTLNAGELVEQQGLVVVHVTYRHLDLVVRVLPGDEQAFQHFRQHGDTGFKVGKALGGVAVHGNVNNGQQREAELFGVQQGAVADDEARFFECTHAAQAGRGGESDAIGQVLVVDAAVGLQDVQNLLVVAVQFHVNAQISGGLSRVCQKQR